MINVGKSAMITANANILFMLYLGYSTGILLGWSTWTAFSGQHDFNVVNDDYH